MNSVGHGTSGSAAGAWAATGKSSSDTLVNGREITDPSGRIPPPMSDRHGAQEREPAGTVDDHQGIRFLRADRGRRGLSLAGRSGCGRG